MATMVLYMTDVQEVVVEEVPEYTLENYMSDVGGASGLILGRVLRTHGRPRVTDNADMPKGDGRRV